MGAGCPPAARHDCQPGNPAANADVWSDWGPPFKPPARGSGRGAVAVAGLLGFEHSSTGTGNWRSGAAVSVLSKSDVASIGTIGCAGGARGFVGIFANQ